jgi:S-adenosylmethionine/arginine decarboxylase-like enzyme
MDPRGLTFSSQFRSLTFQPQEGYREHLMNKKREDQLRGTSGRSDNGEIQEVWPEEEPSRHKWFRKRKKRFASRRSHFDDEADEQADDEDGDNGPASTAGHYDLSTADYAAGERLKAIAAREDVWGIASAIDIYECEPELIRDADAIRRFVAELCELIEMKRFGDTQIVHFGEDERVAGYSMVQLIETSLISAHFANQTNAVYLDVFSCKPYNAQIVLEFSQAFFGGCRSSVQVALRR